MKKHTALFTPFALCLISAFQPFSLSALSAGGIAAGIDRSIIAGIDTVLCKTGARDIVTIEASFPAGSYQNPEDNCSIATLTAAMLDQGAATRDKYAIAAELEAVGATLEFSAGNINVTISGKCLTKDVPLLISLIAEQLRAPAFDAEEFAKIKTQLTGALQRSLENTDARAARAFHGAIYAPGHPNHRHSIEDTIKAINAATPDDVKKFHAANYGPAQFTLVAVGDIDAQTIKTAIAKNFADWKKNTARPIPAPAAPAAPTAPILIQMPGKTSVSIVWGQTTGLRYIDADYHALATATAILGEGFTGRLLANVRDREGLTYGIAARISNDTHATGDFRITATFAPALLDQGIASTRRQLEAWHDKGVTAEELADRKSNLIGAYKVSLATTGGMASAILTTIERGQPLAALDEYPAKIAALTLADVNA
ncbi:MAG: insulinase family protein, partial [Opitutaceae bacterium]|nr:insulinase family protein [Opitutaceae bacterium]